MYTVAFSLVARQGSAGGFIPGAAIKRKGEQL